MVSSQIVSGACLIYTCIHKDMYVGHLESLFTLWLYTERPWRANCACLTSNKMLQNLSPEQGSAVASTRGSPLWWLSQNTCLFGIVLHFYRSKYCLWMNKESILVATLRETPVPDDLVQVSLTLAANFFSSQLLSTCIALAFTKCFWTCLSKFITS